MIIGFGSTEADVRRTFEEEFRAFVAKRYTECRCEYFTNELVEEARQWLSDAARELEAEAARYKTAENFPERYSTIYPRLLEDASTMAVIVKFHHINRRHALSPDGWALMVVEHVFAVHSLDMPRSKAA